MIKTQLSDGQRRVVTKGGKVSCSCCECSNFPSSCNIQNPPQLATSYLLSFVYDSGDEEQEPVLISADLVLGGAGANFEGNPNNGQCEWQATFSVIIIIDLARLQFSPVNCRWEIYSGPAQFNEPRNLLFAFREDANPVGQYVPAQSGVSDILVT
jgi:hypothetical protein